MTDDSGALLNSEEAQQWAHGEAALLQGFLSGGADNWQAMEAELLRAQDEAFSSGDDDLSAFDTSDESDGPDRVPRHAARSVSNFAGRVRSVSNPAAHPIKPIEHGMGDAGPEMSNRGRNGGPSDGDDDHDDGDGSVPSKPVIRLTVRSPKPPSAASPDAAWEQTVADLQVIIDGLRDELSAATDQFRSAHSERLQLKDTLSEERTQLEAVTGALERRIEEAAALQDALRAEQEQREKLSAALQGEQSRVKELEESVSEHASEQKQLAAELEQARADLRRSQEHLEQRQERLSFYEEMMREKDDQYVTKQGAIRDELQRVEARLSALDRDNVRLNVEKSRQVSELEKMQTDYFIVLEQNKTLETQLSALRESASSASARSQSGLDLKMKALADQLAEQQRALDEERRSELETKLEEAQRLLATQQQNAPGWDDSQLESRGREIHAKVEQLQDLFEEKRTLVVNVKKLKEERRQLQQSEHDARMAYESEKRKLTRERMDLALQVSSLEAERDALRVRLDDKMGPQQQHIAHLLDQLSASQAQVSQLRAEAAANAAAQQEKERLQLAAMKRQTAEAKARAAKARKLMEERQEERPTGGRCCGCGGCSVM